MIPDIYSKTMVSLEGIAQQFFIFIPSLVGALIVFIAGWIIACGVGKLIAEILEKMKLNRIFESKGWKEVLEKADIKVNISEFIGAICKWVLVIV